MKFKESVRCSAVFLFFLAAFPAYSAPVIWGQPTAVSGETDVCRFGSLDRAYYLGGASRPINVNGVTFAVFGDSKALASNPESMIDSQTTIGVSGGAGIAVVSKHPVETSARLSPYRALLESGLSSGGWPWEVTFNGLIPGKAYLVQIWADGSGSSQPSHLAGIFTANSESQSLVPDGVGDVMHAFQLRVLPENAKLAIIASPSPMSSYEGKTVKLSVLAVGKGPLAYQWQRSEGGKMKDLSDGERLAGANTSQLTIRSFTPDDAGNYRVLVRDETGFIPGSVAKISLRYPQTNQLINVDIKNGADPVYEGDGVLVDNSGFHIWNGIDGRSSITGVALVDSTGFATPVTLTLIATPQPFAWSNAYGGNALLVDYSCARNQTVTLQHLEPRTAYHLVVYSIGQGYIGQGGYEGGVFSGAVEGMAYGCLPNSMNTTNFVLGTNYVENPFALSDAQGTLTFDIAGTDTDVPGGHYNCDFNGLQIQKAATNVLTPVFVRQPAPVTVYVGRPAALSALAASLTQVSYQWQKISESSTSNLVDGDRFSGAGTSTLTIGKAVSSDAGKYRVLAHDSTGTTTSSVVTVSLLLPPTRQLINVDIKNGPIPPYAGDGVLVGNSGFDVWNGIDGRNSFTNATLVDSTGAATPVTLTLIKSENGVWTSTYGGNALLVDYSCARNQTVTLQHLEPRTAYHLVVYSIGQRDYEGGVFSGAIKGVSQGGLANRMNTTTTFVAGVNYVENPAALSDEHGVISFTIKGNETLGQGGDVNGDFNGLQIMKAEP